MNYCTPDISVAYAPTDITDGSIYSLSAADDSANPITIDCELKIGDSSPLQSYSVPLSSDQSKNFTLDPVTIFSNGYIKIKVTDEIANMTGFYGVYVSNNKITQLTDISQDEYNTNHFFEINPEDGAVTAIDKRAEITISGYEMAEAAEPAPEPVELEPEP